MDNQTELITAVKCLIRVFFGYKPDWIKYSDRTTGLGSDQITERKFWTGLGFQKSLIFGKMSSYDISLDTLTLFFFFTIKFLDCVELRS